MRIPKLAGVGRSAFFSDRDLARRLVLAQGDETRVAQDALVGELGEGDLGDQLGPDEMGASAVAARHLDRRPVDF